MTPLRIAIVGSRLWPGDVAEIDRVVQDLPIGTVIVSGGAPGVDTIAVEAARRHGHDVQIHPARWETLGKRAGFVRNGLIVADSDAVIAFWDGKSKGTADTILKAHAAGKRVTVVLP